jgi:hypothetical protein
MHIINIMIHQGGGVYPHLLGEEGGRGEPIWLFDVQNYSVDRHKQAYYHYYYQSGILVAWAKNAAVMEYQLGS